jgi:antitoxin (DNA-binding transcriptional repressor) of toxin-antitoxin stability system
MMNIPVSQAKAQFSDLIRRVESGEDIILTRNGKPVARLSVPDQAPSKGALRQSMMGKYRDQIRIADDFDDLGADWDEYIR